MRLPAPTRLTITGTSGPTGHSAFATLVLSPPPDFGLTALPASRTVNAGTAAAYTVTISARNGFTAGVSLALTGLPPRWVPPRSPPRSSPPPVPPSCG